MFLCKKKCQIYVLSPKEMIFIFDEICFYILHKGILTNKFKSIHFIREITITPNTYFGTQQTISSPDSMLMLNIQADDSPSKRQNNYLKRNQFIFFYF
jgi:hypothetical protein